MSTRYELMHEHLTEILAEAPQIENLKAKDAEERLKFWRRRTIDSFRRLHGRDLDASSSVLRVLAGRLGNLYFQPIPLIETLRLWRHARDKETRLMLRRNIRGFFVLALTATAFLLTLWVGWHCYERTDAYQLEYVLIHAPLEVANSYREEGLSGKNPVPDWLSALVRAGRTEAAIRSVEKTIVPERLSAAYAVIADAATQSHQGEAAETALEHAIVAAKAQSNLFFRVHSLAELAELCSTAGLTLSAEKALDDASEAANHVTSQFPKVKAFETVAIAASHIGLRTRAEAALENALVAAQTVDLKHQCQAICSVAEVAAEAKSTAMSDKALAIAIVAATSTNATADRTRSLKRVYDSARRCDRKEAMAAAYAAIGHKLSNDDLVTELVNLPVTDYYELNADPGKPNKQLPENVAATYAHLCEMEAQNGRIRAAQDIAERIGREFVGSRSRARRSVAMAMALAGDYYSARRYSEECSDPDKLRVYTAILVGISGKSGSSYLPSGKHPSPFQPYDFRQ